MLHSVLAVLGGFAAMALIVMISTAIAATILIPGGVAVSTAAAPPIPQSYLVTNLICSAVAAFVGGAVTARIAFNAPLAHGAALAGLMVVMSVVSMRQAAGRQPRWYQVTLMTAMPAIALAGAWATGLWSRIPA